VRESYAENYGKPSLTPGSDGSRPPDSDLPGTKEAPRPAISWHICRVRPDRSNVNAE
jgi:hypothetical protein